MRSIDTSVQHPQPNSIEFPIRQEAIDAHNGSKCCNARPRGPLSLCFRSPTGQVQLTQSRIHGECICQWDASTTMRNEHDNGTLQANGLHMHAVSNPQDRCRAIPKAQCPKPNAQSPMPNANGRNGIAASASPELPSSPPVSLEVPMVSDTIFVAS